MNNMTGTAAPRLDMLSVADAVAREKTIDREVVIDAMERALAKAGSQNYGREFDIRATIDRITGGVTLTRHVTVVGDEEEIERPEQVIRLAEAKTQKEDVEIGYEFVETLPMQDFGRIAAQAAKQIIFHKVREADRARQFEEYKDRAGELATGIIKRAEPHFAIIDLGRAEAILRRDQCIPREPIRRDMRIKALIVDVREETRGPQIFLSRTHPRFLSELFSQEAPEVGDGIVEIQAIARDPGSRAKIAVISQDPSVDPVGACVGVRGSRVQAVVAELQGEKIDIIPFSTEVGAFVSNALAPAIINKVVVDEEEKRLEVVVEDDQLSLAIGRRGQNVRLASTLTGWHLDIMTAEEEALRREAEMTRRIDTFCQSLDVDEVIGRLLAGEGFYSVEEIADVDPGELAMLEGFDDSLAEEIQNRARVSIQEAERQLLAKFEANGVQQSLLDIPGLPREAVLKLSEHRILSREDFADAAVEELTDSETGLLHEFKLGHDRISDMIMDARVAEGWFDEEAVEEIMIEREERDARRLEREWRKRGNVGKPPPLSDLAELDVVDTAAMSLADAAAAFADQVPSVADMPGLDEVKPDQPNRDFDSEVSATEGLASHDTERTPEGDPEDDVQASDEEKGGPGAE